ncbi:MAG: sulfur carrier protein ThiS [Gemmatimonadota bacterium]|nr:sulfur carrier protein ThiS [Gemmatimonadota bacterium]MDE2984410.1 sulfur carrier protein ThiS [Gemmatimonadota bacterium]
MTASKGDGMPPANVSIVLNGERRRVAAGLTVAGLLRSLELEPGMVVVERNREILARDAVGATAVEDGDRIELVHFVGGG